MARPRPASREKLQAVCDAFNASHTLGRGRQCRADCGQGGLMSHQSTKIGHGITAREATSLDDLSDADAQSITEAFRDAAQQGWQQGGETSYGMTTADQVAICRAVLNEAGPGKYPIDSAPYFARWYLHLNAAARENVVDCNADLAALTAWESGMVFARADMKWRWEPDALTGQKVRSAAKRGGRPKDSTKDRDLSLARVFKLRRKNARCSDTALKAEIGCEHGLCRSAAVAAINRGLEKLSS
jgi:hypothetical protein